MQSAYGIYQARMGDIRLPPMDVDYLAEIENYPTWVVESEGSILGGLIMMFDADMASIANIAIATEFQGMGIGGGLMRFAESKAREENYSKIQLATHKRLTENISLYQYLGWKETGRDDVRVFMEKQL